MKSRCDPSGLSSICKRVCLQINFSRYVDNTLGVIEHRADRFFIAHAAD